MLGSCGGFPLKHSAAESIRSAIVGYFRVALFNSESYSVSVPVLGTGSVPVSLQGPGRLFQDVPQWLTALNSLFQDVLGG